MRFVLTLLVALLVASPVWAAPTKEQRDKALELYDQAETQYRLLEYQKALDLYKEAYVLSKETSLLFNIAQCYRLLGRYQEAKQTYELYLQDDPGTPYREACERFLQEVEAALAAAPKTTSSPAPTPALTPATPEEAPEAPQSKKLLWVSASLSGVGLLLGGGALLVDRKLTRETDPSLTPDLRSKRLGLSLAADTSFVLAAGVAIGFGVDRLLLSPNKTRGQ